MSSGGSGSSEVSKENHLPLQLRTELCRVSGVLSLFPGTSHLLQGRFLAVEVKQIQAQINPAKNTSSFGFQVLKNEVKAYQWECTGLQEVNNMHEPYTMKLF